jgi:hypothetical protein
MNLAIAIGNASKPHVNAWLGCIPDRVAEDATVVMLSTIIGSDGQRIFGGLNMVPIAFERMHSRPFVVYRSFNKENLDQP